MTSPADGQVSLPVLLRDETWIVSWEWTGTPVPQQSRIAMQDTFASRQSQMAGKQGLEVVSCSQGWNDQDQTYNRNLNQLQRASKWEVYKEHERSLGPIYAKLKYVPKNSVSKNDFAPELWQGFTTNLWHNIFFKNSFISRSHKKKGFQDREFIVRFVLHDFCIHFSSAGIFRVKLPNSNPYQKIK